MKTTTNLHQYSLALPKTYIFASLFVAGNIILPQLTHLMPMGGPTLLPIYFFTLIAAYKFGFATGLITAVLSPFINHLLFGMPSEAMLPVLLSKSILLAISASFVANRFGKVTIALLLLVVLGYQLPGTLVEWLLTGSLALALQDFRIGLPGMAIQILGGYLILRNWRNNNQ